MKKTALWICIVVSIFSSCRKNDDHVFDQSPDQRINAALAAYQAKLTEAENGWKALITVDSGKGATYSFYFNFSNDNRVKMVSDFDSASAVTPQESSYRLKAEQQPTLIFDTYSYIHVLADPNESTQDVFANVNGGVIGQGLLSDFEFIIDAANIKTDSIELMGKVNGSKLVLVKASRAEGDAYLAGQFTLFSSNLDKILTYFKRLTIGSQQYDVQVDPQTRTILFSWLDGTGNTQTFSTTFYNVLGGIVLTKTFVNGGLTISNFSNAVFDASTSSLNVSTAGTSGVLTPTIFPLKVDVNAAKNWWQRGVDEDNYWISINGFHSNGVDDAFGIATLQRYYYSIYWPGYTANNDFFGPIFINTAGTQLELQYGAAPSKPIFGADGITKFKLLGTYGTFPATGPARLSRNQLFIPEGYYFVKIDDNSYDMVSAKDGKTWISWFILN